MKYFGVLGLFDQESDQIVKDIWNELAERQITSSMLKIKGCKPHLSFSLYRGNSISKLEKAVEEFVTKRKKISVSISSIGFFPYDYNSAYLGVTNNPQISAFHQELHKASDGCISEINPLYLPQDWVPHITLATDLNSSQMEEVVNYCIDIEFPQTFNIESLCVTEFDFDDLSWISEKKFDLS